MSFDKFVLFSKSKIPAVCLNIFIPANNHREVQFWGANNKTHFLDVLYVRVLGLILIFFLAHNSSFLLWAKFFDITHAKLPFFIICQIWQHRAHNPLKMFSVVGARQQHGREKCFCWGPIVFSFHPLNLFLSEWVREP